MVNETDTGASTEVAVKDDAAKKGVFAFLGTAGLASLIGSLFGPLGAIGGLILGVGLGALAQMVSDKFGGLVPAVKAGIDNFTGLITNTIDENAPDITLSTGQKVAIGTGLVGGGVTGTAVGVSFAKRKAIPAVKKVVQDNIDAAKAIGRFLGSDAVDDIMKMTDLTAAGRASAQQAAASATASMSGSVTGVETITGAAGYTQADIIPNAEGGAVQQARGAASQTAATPAPETPGTGASTRPATPAPQTQPAPAAVAVAEEMPQKIAERGALQKAAKTIPTAPDILPEWKVDVPDGTFSNLEDDIVKAGSGSTGTAVTESASTLSQVGKALRGLGVAGGGAAAVYEGHKTAEALQRGEYGEAALHGGRTIEGAGAASGLAAGSEVAASTLGSKALGTLRFAGKVAVPVGLVTEGTSLAINVHKARQAEKETAHLYEEDNKKFSPNSQLLHLNAISGYLGDDIYRIEERGGKIINGKLDLTDANTRDLLSETLTQKKAEMVNIVTQSEKQMKESVGLLGGLFADIPAWEAATNRFNDARSDWKIYDAAQREMKVYEKELAQYLAVATQQEQSVSLIGQEADLSASLNKPVTPAQTASQDQPRLPGA